MKKIMIVILGISLFLEADFYRNDSQGIVTDSITSLQWQDDYTPYNPTIRNANWEDAIDYCNDLTLGEYSDWRLPNINELSTIVDFDKGSSPYISNVFVYITTADNYWSSTTYASNSDYAWVVYFSSGHQYVSSKGYNYYVRCVRAGL